MEMQIRPTSDDCREVFHKLLKVYEPERMLLGELGFIRLVTGMPDLTSATEPDEITLQFTLTRVCYICGSKDGKLWHISPRTYTPRREAIQRWNQMIQERI